MEGLDILVERFGKMDAEIKELKKTNDKDKEEIKKALENLGESDWTAGGYRVKRVESTTETMNETKTLALMCLHREIAEQLGIIKTKEYVDFEALEAALYAGAIPAEIMADMDTCRETKTTISLRCTKVKEA